MTYTSEKYNITIIEINNEFKENQINNFLKFDENFNKFENYIEKEIYLIQDNCYSIGKVTAIYDSDLEYICNDKDDDIKTPIFLFSNNEIIGIHQTKINENKMLGNSLKFPIKEFYEKYIKNDITITLYIEEKDLSNKSFLFFNKKSNIYFLYKEDDYECRNDVNKMNESNSYIYIDRKKAKINNYFSPEHEGIYTINLKFKYEFSNCRDMFLDCKNINSISFNKVNTKNVTTMRGMFKGLKNLISVDLSFLDTENVISFAEMFYNCNSLIQLNLSNFLTYNAENMEEMFYNCSQLTNINLFTFNTENVKNMKSMFKGCANLTSIDLSSFSFKNIKETVTDYNNFEQTEGGFYPAYTYAMEANSGLEEVFSGCHNLKEIFVNEQSANILKKETNIPLIIV